MTVMEPVQILEGSPTSDSLYSFSYRFKEMHEIILYSFSKYLNTCKAIRMSSKKKTIFKIQKIKASTHLASYVISIIKTVQQH